MTEIMKEKCMLSTNDLSKERCSLSITDLSNEIDIG